MSDIATRNHRAAVVAAVVASVVAALALVALVASFALGYRLGADREGKRLLGEFLVNADHLGLIDQERLRELVEAPETDGEGF